jgi:hypothetical protein
MASMGVSETVDGDIRERAASYLQGEISRDAFEEWIVGATWECRTELAAEVDHLFAEASVLGADQFDIELERLISTVWVGLVSTPRTSSVLETHETPFVALRTTTITRPLAFSGT